MRYFDTKVIIFVDRVCNFNFSKMFENKYGNIVDFAIENVYLMRHLTNNEQNLERVFEHKSKNSMQKRCKIIF